MVFDGLRHGYGFKSLGDFSGYGDRSSKLHCQSWPCTRINQRDLPWFHQLASMILSLTLPCGVAWLPPQTQSSGFITFEFYTLVPPSQTFTRCREQLGILLKNAVSGCMPEAGDGGWGVA